MDNDDNQIPPFRTSLLPDEIPRVEIVSPELPEWLLPTSPPSPRTSKEALALEHAQYEIVFDTVMERMGEGVTMTAALQEFPHDIKRGKFRSWVMKDPARRELLEEAEKLLGDCLFEDFVEMNRKTGEDLIDLEAFKIKSQNLRWLLQVYNRKRFGDKQAISMEVNQTISITGALQDAERRLQMVVDVTASEVTPSLPSPPSSVNKE